MSDHNKTMSRGSRQDLPGPEYEASFQGENEKCIFLVCVLRLRAVRDAKEAQDSLREVCSIR